MGVAGALLKDIEACQPSPRRAYGRRSAIRTRIRNAFDLFAPRL